MSRAQTAVFVPAEPHAPIVPIAPIAAVVPDAVSPPQAGYNLAVGYLRAFVTVLVLAHHAVLAYNPYAPSPAASLLTQPRWWKAFPIVDGQRWPGFGLFVGYNDTFFMALMFFLSGLFVWNGLRRKGGAGFLRDRARRLGLPFLVAAAVLAPLAYYPAYLQTGAAPGLAGFWRQWRALGEWPAGPAWFLWVLLAFDAVAALLFALLPRWGEALGGRLAGAARRPITFFALLVAVSAVAYIPMALAFGPFDWATFGPFYVQTSRILHYAAYFLLGAGVGACGLERGLLAPDGKLARRWPLWLTASLLTFGLALTVFVLALAARGAAPRFWGTLGGFTFVLASAAASLAFLALAARFARARSRVFDSLRDNAYGMYLIHYLFVSWLQLALLRAALPGVAKGTLAFLGTLALSWGATAALRRIPGIPGVARVI